MMKKYSLNHIILILILLSSFSFGQNRYDIKQFVSEAGDFYSRPVNWKGNDWLKAAIIVSATYGLMNFDEDVRENVQQNQTMRGTIPIDFGRMWGEPLVSGMITGFLLIQSAITKNKKNRDEAFDIIQSQLFAASLTGILKIGFGRSRPYMNNGAFEYDPLHFATRDFWSFPSGHTTMAFALSTTLSEHIDNNFLKAAVFVPAIVTAYSRVYEDKHWLSDVFLGACIGYFTAKYLSDLHKSKEQFPTLEDQTPLFFLKITL